MWLNKYEIQEWAYHQCWDHPELRNELKHLIDIPFIALRYCQNIENDPIVKKKITVRSLLEWTSLDFDCPIYWYNNVKYCPNLYKRILYIIFVTISIPIFIVCWLITEIEDWWDERKISHEKKI